MWRWKEVDGWMKGCMCGWIDRWMVDWMVGQMDGWVDEQMVGWMYRQMDNSVTKHAQFRPFVLDFLLSELRED